MADAPDGKRAEESPKWELGWEVRSGALDKTMAKVTSLPKAQR